MGRWLVLFRVQVKLHFPRLLVIADVQDPYRLTIVPGVFGLELKNIPPPTMIADQVATS
jgi:hypothetical protein